MLPSTRTSVGEPPIQDHETIPVPVAVAATVRFLQRSGFSPNEAVNLTARVAGLPTVRGGWSPRQVEHLIFLRAIVGSGRLAG
jgi:hypothetical protein